MTVSYDVKIVPDAEPNADGRWIVIEVLEADVKNGLYNLYPVPGHPDHHIVMYRRTPHPQDGGPMHASFLSVNRKDR